MHEKEKQVGYEEAEQVLLGNAPALDPTEGWSEEDKAKIAEIMRQVEPKEEEQELDLRRYFRKGNRITDPEGLTILVRTVGKSALCVEVAGKKGRFVDNQHVRINNFVFQTTSSKKQRSVLQLIGIAQDTAGGDDGQAEAG